MMFSYIVRDPVTTSALLLGRIVGVYAGVLSGSLLHTIHTIHDTNCNNRIKKPDWLYPPRISLLNKRTNQRVLSQPRWTRPAAPETEDGHHDRSHSLGSALLLIGMDRSTMDMYSYYSVLEY